MRKRSLLVIATIAWVAPLSAHGPVSMQARGYSDADCPVAKAKVAAAKAEAARKAGAATGPRAVAAPVDVPGEGSVFAIGRGSSFLMP